MLWLVSPASSPTILDASDTSAEERQRNLGLESNTGGHVSKGKEINVLCLPISSAESPISKGW